MGSVLGTYHPRAGALIPLFIFAAALVAVCSSCSAGDDPTLVPDAGSSDQLVSDAEPPRPDGEQAPPTLESIGISAAAIDPTVDPCEDFYQYACGRWRETADIPQGEPHWVRSFHEIDRRNQEVLKQLLEAGAAGTDSDPVVQSLVDYYGACMDLQAVEAGGTSAIEPLLDEVRSITQPADVTAALALLHQHDIAAPWRLIAEPNYHDPSVTVLYLYQGGLGLFDREIYLGEDSWSSGIRNVYRQHVQLMMQLAGLSAEEATQVASDVLLLEIELAASSRNEAELHDLRASFNEVTRAELVSLAGNIDWDDYFTALGMPDVEDIAVTGKPFVQAVSDLATSQPPRVWASYLQWWVVHAQAHTLSAELVKEHQEMFGGEAERWRACVRDLVRMMPQAAGKAFAGAAFSANAKDAAEAMVEAIGQAFVANLGHVGWMDEDTRQHARDKLAKVVYEVGYPDDWNTCDFSIDPADYAGNALEAQRARLLRELEKVGAVPDRREWTRSPAETDAAYSPEKNRVLLPAAILQPPMFSVDNSPVVNFGSIGTVVGHELTHGFDNQGALFNGDGKLEDWWSTGAAAEFQSRTGCLVDQYSGYEVLPGKNIEGDFTAGENIADLGGVKLAFLAYRSSRGDGPDRPVEGYTEDQQFFLAAGQIWCAATIDRYLEWMLDNDPHAPPKYRVNGPLSNLAEFAAAFSCEKGSRMNPNRPCVVW